MKKTIYAIIILAVLAVVAWLILGNQEQTVVAEEVIAVEATAPAAATAEEVAVDIEPADDVVDAEVEEINPDETQDEGETIVNE